MFCPFSSGSYTFGYVGRVSKDDLSSSLRCPPPEEEDNSGGGSTLQNCPTASAVGVRFRNCNFRDGAVRFRCLGHWTSPRRTRAREVYVILMEEAMGEEEEGAVSLGPKYRCGVSGFKLIETKSCQLILKPHIEQMINPWS